MAEGDTTITDCTRCGHTLAQPIKSRQMVSIKLNGTGGQFPAATLNVDDTIGAAFKKNDGAFQELNKTYAINHAPSEGMRLVATVYLKIEEEPIS